MFAKAMLRATSLRLLALATLLGFGSALAAPVTTITPNGLGTTVSSTPGFYNITGGTTAGSNLFHSFSTFNLGTGDTADFVVTNNIANILTRVTGGPSTIDGTITSTVGVGGPLSSANLFFINPAGVMFTANAQVNLGGSFVVSTANYVKFSDGSMFYGDVNHPIQDAGLTTAPVSAFGFLTPTPAPISFAGSQITLPGTGLHVIGGDVTVDGTTLAAPSGLLTIFSAASAGELVFDLSSAGSGYASAPFSAFGNITFQNQSNVTIDGSEGGNIVIRGGRLVVDNSSVSAANSGSTSGGNIDILGTYHLIVENGGHLNVLTDGTGTGGNIDIEGGTIAVTGTDPNGNSSSITSKSYGSGNSGNVTIKATGSLILSNGGQVNAIAEGTGNSGGILIQARSSTIAGGGSSINADTYGTGNSGGVVVTVEGELDLSGGGTINTLSEPFEFNGGNIIGPIIHAGQLTIEGTDVFGNPSGIFAGTFGTGSVGNLDVLVTRSLTVRNGGVIDASTGGTGAAGNIDVSAGSLSIDGSATPSNFTGIEAQAMATGNAGDVNVYALSVTLLGGGTISTSSSMSIAGSILINAANLSLQGYSSIDASAAEGGGNVDLNVSQLLYLLDSQVVAEVTGSYSSGGNIVIDPEFMVLNHSLISAANLSGSGGSIGIISPDLLSSESEIVSNGITFAVPPDPKLAVGLFALPAVLDSDEKRLREKCARAVNHEFSSFIVVGRGGTESAPDELQPDFGFGELPLTTKQ